MKKRLQYAGVGIAIVALASCMSLTQDDADVLVRAPALKGYQAPIPIAAHAKSQWEYAAMSLNAYMQVAELEDGTATQPVLRDNARHDKAQFDKACTTERTLMPLRGWTRWQQFPGPQLRRRMLSQGMYFEVFERTSPPRTIAVVFEGTTPGKRDDWPSNLHWVSRFIPGDDQYTIASKEATREFLDYLKARRDAYTYSAHAKELRSASGEPIKLVATGHSLGGGLAQHFAYNFAQEAPQPGGPKVAEVYAFNTSPVTGWFSSPEPGRSYNAAGLQIHRVWERGEVLGFVRYVTSRFAMSSENPAIWEYRYNFDPKANIVRNHSMQNLACGLANAASPWAGI